MHRVAKTTLVLSALATLLVGAGFVWQWPWALWLWPWPDGRLSYIFLGSIAAAIGAPILWIGLRGAYAAIPGGALNLLVTMGGMSFHVLSLFGRNGGTALLVTGIVTGGLALLNLWLFLATRRLPVPDRRPLPVLVRTSFAIFTVVLIVVGTALVLRAAHVFPWPLKSDSSVMFGFIFLGASLYFLYGFLRPLWFNAFGPLLGFLAYDLVLVIPYARHFDDVKPEHRLSLIVYMIVIVYSLLLALYFLAFNPGTRVRDGRPDKLRT